MSEAAAAPVAAFVVSAVVVLLLSRHASRLPQDAANARSLHRGAVPRAGGLAILAGAAVAVALAPPHVAGGAWWAAAVVAVAAVSFADDVRGVTPIVRLAVHLVAGAAVAWQMTGSPSLAIVVALAIVWGANLFNFMDGSDGLAATMAATGFAALAAAAAIAGQPWHAWAGIAAATLPFLAVNRPRASMFMGDVGAVPLGFAAASAGIAGTLAGVWPAWFPLLAFLPFVADASVTLAARLARGERVWHAHRSHYYQRLNTLGAGHRGTLAVYGALMLACAAIGVACLLLRPDAGWIALAVAVAAHAIAFRAIAYHERHPKRTDPTARDDPPRQVR